MSLRDLEIGVNDDATKEFHDYIERHDVPETKQYIAYRESNRELQKGLVVLLDTFYNSKDFLVQRGLIMKGIGGGNAFKVIAELADPEYKFGEDEVIDRQVLADNQKELREFAEFLKTRYFAS